MNQTSAYAAPRGVNWIMCHYFKGLNGIRVTIECVHNMNGGFGTLEISCGGKAVKASVI